MDSKFIEQIYNKYYKFVYTIVKNSIYSSQEIESCVHDVFIAAIEYVNLEKHPNIEGWLFITAKNISKQFNHKYLLRVNKITDEDENIIAQRDFISALEEDDEYIHLINNGIIKKILDSFTENEKVLYWLKYSQHKTYEEISDILNVSAGALMTRNSRMISKAKRIINSMS